MKRTILAVVAVLALAGCGSNDAFGKWADRALNSKTDTSNIGAQVDSGNLMVALICSTWATSSAETRTKAPASLAESATAAGFESSPDDALAWLDANCS